MTDRRPALCFAIFAAAVGFSTPFAAADDTPAAAKPHLVMVIGEDEYKTWETLPAFGRDELEDRFRVTYILSDDEKDKNDFPGLEKIGEADVVLISVRRRVLPPEQMAAIRKFVADGKPLVGIRTACHAFSLRGKVPPEGRVAWEEFDPEVLGGHYTGHHGNKVKPTLKLAEGAADHAILRGVDLNQLRANGSLYLVSPLAASTAPLLIGSIPNESAEPVAWTNAPQSGGRVFFTSLGHPDDFQSPGFRKLLVNGIFWAAGIEP